MGRLIGYSGDDPPNSGEFGFAQSFIYIFFYYVELHAAYDTEGGFLVRCPCFELFGNDFCSFQSKNVSIDTSGDF